MKISVIMVDGGFRENTFGAEYFSKQDFPDAEFEIIWVEFYSKVPDEVRKQQKVKIITLNNPEDKIYHSSYCFNAGIQNARGELIVIPDADQIVRPDFLSSLWKLHENYDRLVAYCYRYDENEEGQLKSLDWNELDQKCELKNPKNYGGCLSVRKKWLLEINGYEQHCIFESGFHANGLDIYTRFKNLGLAIQWVPDLKLYHPWHPFSRVVADQYKPQHLFIEWRFKNLQYMAISGIDSNRNFYFSGMDEFFQKSKHKQQQQEGIVSSPKIGFFRRLISRF